MTLPPLFLVRMYNCTQSTVVSQCEHGETKSTGLFIYDGQCVKFYVNCKAAFSSGGSRGGGGGGVPGVPRNPPFPSCYDAHAALGARRRARERAT